MVEKKIRVFNKLDIDTSFEKLSFEELSSNLCEYYKSIRGRTGECNLNGEFVNVLENGCRNKYDCVNYRNVNGGMI